MSIIHVVVHKMCDGRCSGDGDDDDDDDDEEDNGDGDGAGALVTG